MYHQATMKSWEYNFLGNSHELLREIILHYATNVVPSQIYAQIIPIVQSSGTGKSRMIHELSKQMIVIFVNEGRGKAAIFYVLYWSMIFGP